MSNELIGANIYAILTQIGSAPPVRVAQHVDNSVAKESARQALQRAGYNVNF
jgi:hypothetical protein